MADYAILPDKESSAPSSPALPLLKPAMDPFVCLSNILAASCLVVTLGENFHLPLLVISQYANAILKHDIT
ncbi:uncharacterized [Tachysurus ichikawai]